MWPALILTSILDLEDLASSFWHRLTSQHPRNLHVSLHRLRHVHVFSGGTLALYTDLAMSRTHDQMFLKIFSPA